MKQFIILTAALIGGASWSGVSAQNFSENKESILMPPPDLEIKAENSGNEIYSVVEQPAEFPGGLDALMHWLSNNVRYPDVAQQQGVEGRVVVRFVVEKDGTVDEVEVIKGADRDLDAEAVRVVSIMPKWIPGKQYGELVRSYFTLPVIFKLSRNDSDDRGGASGPGAF